MQATIDIMFDRGGFYLFWGVCCWMQVMYCLPATYLWKNPVDLSPTWLVIAATLHVVGTLCWRGGRGRRSLGSARALLACWWRVFHRVADPVPPAPSVGCVRVKQVRVGGPAVL